MENDLRVFVCPNWFTLRVLNQILWLIPNFTSLSGGDMVDGLPPASNPLVYILARGGKLKNTAKYLNQRRSKIKQNKER